MAVPGTGSMCGARGRAHFRDGFNFRGGWLESLVGSRRTADVRFPGSEAETEFFARLAEVLDGGRRFRPFDLESSCGSMAAQVDRPRGNAAAGVSCGLPAGG